MQAYHNDRDSDSWPCCVLWTQFRGEEEEQTKVNFCPVRQPFCLFSPVPHALIYRTKIKASRDLYSVFWCHCFSTGRGPFMIILDCTEWNGCPKFMTTYMLYFLQTHLMSSLTPSVVACSPPQVVPHGGLPHVGGMARWKSAWRPLNSRSASGHQTGGVCQQAILGAADTLCSVVHAPGQTRLDMVGPEVQYWYIWVGFLQTVMSRLLPSLEKYVQKLEPSILHLVGELHGRMHTVETCLCSTGSVDDIPKVGVSLG